MTQQDAEVISRLDRVESLLKQLVDRQRVQEWYTVAEFAKALGLSEYTVREHFRLGRLRGVKRKSGRGKHSVWVASHDELLRYQKEGLLPDSRLPEHGPNGLPLNGGD